MRIVYGMSESGTRGRRARLTPAERAAALAELKAGGTIKTVAAGMGVGRDTLRKVRDSAVRPDGAVTSAAQPVAARVSPAEMQAFDAVIGRAGYRSRSEGLRVLIRMSAGFLELSREENAALDALTAELGKIGVNVNQIARLANSDRLKIVKVRQLTGEMTSEGVGLERRVAHRAGHPVVQLHSRLQEGLA